MSSDGNLRVPAYTLDGPSDTRSQGGRSEGGRSQGGRSQGGASQPGGSQPSASQPGGSRAGSHHGGSPPTKSHASGSQHGGSQPPSQSGSPPKSAGPSGPPGGDSHARPGPSTGASPFPKGTGVDPALDPLVSHPREDLNTRIDLPPEAYIKTKDRAPFARRPAFGTLGRNVSIQVNQFRFLSVPSMDVYQYDISITPQPSNIIMYKKVWETGIVQRKLRSSPNTWLYDGRKLAWSRNRVDDGFRITVDMNLETNRQSTRDNTFYLIVKPTTKVRMASLKEYLQGKADWDVPVLEAINFLDHVIRQHPSTYMLAIKRNFYDRTAPRVEMQMNVIEAVKGIHASLRLSESIKSGGFGLGINVDVTHTCFWKTEGEVLLELIRFMVLSYKKEWEQASNPEIGDLLAPVVTTHKDNRSGPDIITMSEAFQLLRKLHKLTFFIKHRGKESDPKEYRIMRFMFDPKYGKAGANARTVTFEYQGQTVNIFQYFRKKYQITLESSLWPLVETTRHGLFPVEVIQVHPLQRYNFKLDPAQTARMIKFAVTRPPQRYDAVMKNVAALKWGEDPILKEFGLRIDPKMPTVTGRVIPNPEVQYANKKIDPKLSGRWDLRGVKFLSFPRKIRTWGFVIMNNCCDPATAMNFARQFSNVYQGHGGNIAGGPRIYHAQMQVSLGKVLKDHYKHFVKISGQPPEIWFFVLPDKNYMLYERLKKNMDCRFAVLTQMVNVAHVRKAQPQYCSNVAMKVNAKLGGQNSRVPSPKGPSAFFTAPTMMIGVDVSHGGLTGIPTASMAAMTMSIDQDAATYIAACQTNGYKVEVLTPSTIHSCLPTMVKRWVARMNGAKPQHVFYLRDGVAESMFGQVLKEEIKEVRKIFQEVCNMVPKITVIIATKRHHIRFFPVKGHGDRNGNPLPGTVVEREVTHPFHYDFYMCSHVAIQGTARPVHYTVIQDEVGMKPDDLQRMIYQQCYQYQRSTTPVSLHPAVYYAHLASYRARSHEDTPSSHRDPDWWERQHLKLAHKHEDDGKPSVLPPSLQNPTGTESVPLLEMGVPEDCADKNFAEFMRNWSMWYI